MSTVPLRCEKQTRRTLNSELLLSLLLSIVLALTGRAPHEGESTISERAQTAQ